MRAYLAKQPPAARRILKGFRDIIRAAAPGATDAISYGIPAFRQDGRVLIWYAGWKEHVSLYPVSAGMKRALGAGIKDYQISKGTIRFPLTDPPSAALVRKLVKARAADVKAAGKAAKKA